MTGYKACFLFYGNLKAGLATLEVNDENLKASVSKNASNLQKRCTIYR